MQLIDSHCHLNRLDCSERSLENYLDEAKTHHIAHCLCVCVELTEMPRLFDIAEEFSNVSLSTGQHPSDIGETALDADRLLECASHAKVVGIGETGLDYFHTQGESAQRFQQEALRQHIHVAKQVKKPLIIHTRQARADTLRILKEEGADEIGGVMHCFTEDWETAQGAMDLGFYISFSGIITFKNAVELQEVAKKIPADRLLIETDSPYLAPMPYRGKPNEPAYVRYVAAALSTLRGEALEKIAEITTANFQRLFKKVG